MPEQVNILVIGGGVAGLSTAYHLAKKGVKGIALIEHERKIGGHASGRNAGMIRQAVSDPVLARLAIEGRKRLSRLPKEGWKNLDLRPNGSLLIAKRDGMTELKKIDDAIRSQGLTSRWFSKRQCEKKVGLLKGGDFEEALFCPTDFMLDIDALLRGFVEKLKTKGVRLYFNHSLQSIKKEKDGFKVRAGGKNILAEKIINAAGAWAGRVAEKAGASKIPLKAYRRHLFSSDSFKPVNRAWPFVWDLSHEFYFRPYGKELLLSPCDKTLCGGRAMKEAIDPKMRGELMKKLNQFSDRFKPLKISNVKSGLRTMTPDGRFVIGEDANLKNFYWVAGLGGHGVTTCLSVGDLASDLILGRRINPQMKKALSPERFL